MSLKYAILFEQLQAKLFDVTRPDQANQILQRIHLCLLFEYKCLVFLQQHDLLRNKGAFVLSCLLKEFGCTLSQKNSSKKQSGMDGKSCQTQSKISKRGGRAVVLLNGELQMEEHQRHKLPRHTHILVWPLRLIQTSLRILWST